MDRLRAPATTPSGEVRKAEAAHMLSLTLGALSEDRRKLVELHFLEGLEVADVAEAVGRPASTVRRLLAQTLRELRARIRQLGLGSDA
jgi:RNA polymerase sigma-70 factor (ECF subfamily)